MNTLEAILKNELRLPIIKIGRIAGQYAKPRSSNFEIIDGIEIPVFRGENVNSYIPNLNERTPNPLRLKEGYFMSVSTLNLIRAFLLGNYNDHKYFEDWFGFPNSIQISNSQLFERYKRGLSLNLISSQQNNESNNFFISHEALLLDYEQAFTRIDTTNGKYYNTSSHFLWLGERTRSLTSAHVEYLRGIGNPIGIKIGPNYNIDELLDIIRLINPENSNGKIVLIARLGIKNFKNQFPLLVKKITENLLNVIWMVDPMHGNTINFMNKKIRKYDDIFNETVIFIRECYRLNIHPGGIHLEMTSKLVSECVGGVYGVKNSEVDFKYETIVDPRLNGAQVVELILEISKILNRKHHD
jgi:3-deoxy-7-phosphoheptulonate synthase